MKILDSTVVPFGDLGVGDFFKYEGMIYCKLQKRYFFEEGMFQIWE